MDVNSSITLQIHYAEEYVPELGAGSRKAEAGKLVEVDGETNTAQQEVEQAPLARMIDDLLVRDQLFSRLDDDGTFEIHQRAIERVLTKLEVFPFVEFSVDSREPSRDTIRAHGNHFCDGLELPEDHASRTALVERVEDRVLQFGPASAEYGRDVTWARLFCRDGSQLGLSQDMLSHIDAPDSSADPQLRYIETLAGRKGTWISHMPREVVMAVYAELLSQIEQSKDEDGFFSRDNELVRITSELLHRRSLDFEREEIKPGQGGSFLTGVERGAVHYADPDGGSRVVLTLYSHRSIPIIKGRATD